jgi:hypothetical protein
MDRASSADMKSGDSEKNMEEDSGEKEFQGNASLGDNVIFF